MSSKEETLYLEIRENIKNIGLAFTVAVCFCLLSVSLIILSTGNVLEMLAMNILGVAMGFLLGRYQAQNERRQEKEFLDTGNSTPTNSSIEGKVSNA